jgi:hypothetical protein
MSHHRITRITRITPSRATVAALAALAPLALLTLLGLGSGPVYSQSRGASVTVAVTVQDGQISVSSEGVSLPEGVNTISWVMRSAGWRFMDGSIDFGEAARFFNCKVFNDGAAISCNRSSGAPRGALPYRIRVSEGAALVEPPQPYVFIQID